MDRRMRTKISSWVRQARHRARRHQCICRLSLNAVIPLLENGCAYCDNACSNLDHAFPLSDGAPNVLANTVAVCAGCKRRKGQRDLTAYYESGSIDGNRYLAILRSLLARDGAIEMRAYLRKITGIGLDDC